MISRIFPVICASCLGQSGYTVISPGALLCFTRLQVTRNIQGKHAGPFCLSMPNLYLRLTRVEKEGDVFLPQYRYDNSRDLPLRHAVQNLC